MVALKNPKNIDTGWGDLDMFGHLAPQQLGTAVSWAWNGGGYSKEHFMCDAPKMVLSTMDTLLDEYHFGTSVQHACGSFEDYTWSGLVDSMRVRKNTYRHRLNYGHYNTVKRTYA